MGQVSPRRALLRAFLVLAMSFSLLTIYSVLYRDGSGVLTVSSLQTSKLGEVFVQSTGVSIPWSDSSTPLEEDISAALGPEATQKMEDFTEDAFPHLHDLCSRTTWRPDLALHCHSHCGPNKSSFCGGLNNARDRLQTCVRLAIDAGATTVLIPSIAARSESALWTVDPSAVTEDVGTPIILCPQAWFSFEQLEQALSKGCQQLTVKFVCPTEYGLGGLFDMPNSRVVEMLWRPLGGHRYDIRPGHTFREAVSVAMSNSPGESVSALVEYGDPYIAWNYTYGNELYTVYKDLFRAVGYNQGLRSLGRRIIQTPRLKDASYIGIHLRGENDWPEEWGSLEEQTISYVTEIQRLSRQDGDIRTIYVSCGNQTSVQYFRQAVEPLGYSVFDKWTVFETDWPEGLAIVESLPFDQKAVVEYEALVTGKYFLGISLSSMSNVIATHRTLDEPGDFLETYIASTDADSADQGRRLEVRGNMHTRLLSITGIDW